MPPQDEDLFMYGSNDYGETWPDTFFVSDTTFAGIGPELAINCSQQQPDPVLHLIRQKGLLSNSTQEILYQRSTDGGETWLGPIIISDHDTIHSQWPQIAAWGDSNVIATWMDYKYSDQQFSGDAFVSKSSDNGETWSTPIAMTFSHLIKSSDIAASGDTVVLAYDFGPASDDKAIYANVSFDGGETWQGEIRVTDDVQAYRIEPSVALGSGYAHLAWSDARDIGGVGNVEAYYDRGHLDTSVVGIICDEGGNIPEDISISAYPNPFNSSVLVGYSNLKGGEIRIFDIKGQLIRIFFTGGENEGRIKWDATDAMGNKISSGIYFARAGASQESYTIKLIYLK